MLGLALGWLARIVLGVPAEETGPSRSIQRPLSKPAVEEVIDLPILDSQGQPVQQRQDQSGLVPPLRLPGQFPGQLPGQANGLEPGNDVLVSLPGANDREFAHDPTAMFEPHGEQLCASGCAASRHPTERLTRSEFLRLLHEFTYEPMDQTNNALESLLYFGPQTRQWIESVGMGTLDQERAEFLWEQLQFTHANVSIRVTDDQGVVRSWVDATRVPFDRRHLFDMKTNGVQPLVTSGTVKRVGLNHSWVRL